MAGYALACSRCKGRREKVAERYANWQGTYSAMFLMALQPAVFGNGFTHWCHF